MLLCKLAQAWKARREGQGLKPGTQKHAAAQLEFWMGAYTVLSILGPSAPQINEMVLVTLAVCRDWVAECDKDNEDAPARTPGP